MFPQNSFVIWKDDLHYWLTHWILGKITSVLTMFLNTISWLTASTLPVKMPSDLFIRILFIFINSLGLNDAIWRQRSGSTLAQVMACCLTAPSHYLNQCWLFIRKVQWYSSEDNFRSDISATNHEVSLKIIYTKFHWNLSGANELKWVMTRCLLATSHYLHQRWTRSMISYGTTRQQWINVLLICP